MLVRTAVVAFRFCLSAITKGTGAREWQKSIEDDCEILLILYFSDDLFLGNTVQMSGNLASDYASELGILLKYIHTVSTT